MANENEDKDYVHKLKKEIFDMQFMQKEFDVEIEEHLAAIRIRRASNSMHPVDLMQNEMGIADEEFGY